MPERNRSRVPDAPRDHVAAGNFEKEPIEESVSVDRRSVLRIGTVRHEKSVGRALAKPADHQLFRRGSLKSGNEGLVHERILAARHEKKEPGLRKDSDGSSLGHRLADDARG